jgi:hypothetical protein
VLSFSPGRNGPRARSAGVRRRRTGAPPPAPHGGLGSTGSFHRRRTAARPGVAHEERRHDRCSSSARPAVRNWVRTSPPPSTISRLTPRARRSSPIRHISIGRPPSTTVATAPSLRHGVGGTVDQLLGVTGDEEGGARVQLSATGDGHLDRGWRQAAGDALGAPRRRTHQQPGVVVADGCGAHEDRVAVRTHGVDPVEVGIIGQHETFVGRGVDVAVDRHAAAEQCVRAFRHVRRPRLAPPAPQSARTRRPDSALARPPA